MKGILDHRHHESSNRSRLMTVFQHFLDLRLVGEHQYSASLLHSHDTETRATMNMAVGSGVIAAGQDGTCCLMSFKHCPQREGDKAASKDGESICVHLHLLSTA